MSEDQKLEIYVSDLTCSGCVSALTNVAHDIDGVTSCAVELNPDSDSVLTVALSNAQPQFVMGELARAGYEVRLVSP